MATTASPPVSPVAGPSDTIMTSAAANLPSAPVELDGSPVTHHSTCQPSETSRSEERAKAHAAKQKDPAVLVDIPKTPAAQDYEVAENKGSASAE